MTSIVLTDEQARQLQSASLPIVLLDSRGQKLAELPSIEHPQEAPPTIDSEWLQEAQRRRDRALRDGLRGSTTEEVLNRLRAIRPE